MLGIRNAVVVVLIKPVVQISELVDTKPRVIRLSSMTLLVEQMKHLAQNSSLFSYTLWLKPTAVTNDIFVSLKSSQVAGRDFS